MWLSWLGWDGLNHLPEFDVIGERGWGATNSSKPTLRAGGIRRALNWRWWAVDRRFGCRGVLRSRLPVGAPSSRGGRRAQTIRPPPASGGVEPGKCPNGLQMIEWPWPPYQIISSPSTSAGFLVTNTTPRLNAVAAIIRSIALAYCAKQRHPRSSPLMFGCRRRGAAPDRVHAEQRRRVFRVDGRMPTMTALQRQSSKR
jgi:hypothetical protein